MLAPFLWIGAKLVGIHPVFGSIGNGIGKAFAWITASAAHILAVALIAALAWGYIGHHETAKWKRVASSEKIARKADARVWSAADRINHKSIDLLLATVGSQNAAIDLWADVARAKQTAAAAALRGAVARSRAGEVSAARIDAEALEVTPEHTPKVAPECRSGKAVMAAKGDL